MSFRRLLFALGLVAAARLPVAGAAPKFDVLVRGGTVVDGSGGERFRADVGVRGGRIVAVGNLDDAAAAQVLDAEGRIVCPGFVDLHSHADRGILEFRAAENYLRQGATTLVCGNCGSSPVDVGDFFQRLRDGGCGPNIAVLVGHGSVRAKVMGRVNRPPDEKQLDEMKRLVRAAMRDGAVGMSTGLRYGAGAYAETDEVVALAREIAPFGGFYATHMRDEGTKILAALDEALFVGRQAGVPVHVSHHKISAASVFGLTRLTLARIDEARAAGRDVTLDQYPYGAGSGSLSFYVPQDSLAGGLPAYRRRIEDPGVRKQIVAGVEAVFRRKLFEAGQQHDNPQHVAQALGRIQIARARHAPELEGQNLTQILRANGRPVTVNEGAELLVDLVAEGTGGINHTLDDRPGRDVDRVMRHPQTCIASDGGVFEFGLGNPHPRSYGCYPRVLGHYVRKRGVLTLEEAVHKMSGLPARRLAWHDRGLVKAGYWADLVVFDPDAVRDKATFLKPHQHSVGVDHVMVNGEITIKAGQLTGALPGRPLGAEERMKDETMKDEG